MSIEENLIQNLSHSLIHFSAKDNSYKFQCPYCQCGRKNKKGKAFSPSKASGYLYRAKDGWNYKCHRENHCGVGMSFTAFLKEQFPNEYLNYVRLREERGTTGYQTNCPSLSTALKRQSSLPNHPPKFHDPDRLQKQSQTPPGAAVRPLQEPEQQSVPKVTKLPPMRSPQQQAGHQAKINHLVKEREKRRRERSGELW